MDPELLNQISNLLSDKDINLNQILENFQTNTTDENTQNTSEEQTKIDPEMILKFQKILTLLNQNKNSKDETLLRALKPYMRDSRKLTNT